MERNESLEKLVDVIGCIVRVSEALFGFIYEMHPDRADFQRGKPFFGKIDDSKVISKYYKSVGRRALELAAEGHDQAVPVSSLEADPTLPQKLFAVIITQDLIVPACVAILYEFYSPEESVRTLRLVEMILTTRSLK